MIDEVSKDEASIQNKNTILNYFGQNLTDEDMGLKNMIEEVYLGSPYAKKNILLYNNKEERLLLELLHKLAPKFRKAEQILTHIPENKKQIILGYILHGSISFSDPLKKMTELVKMCQNIA